MRSLQKELSQKKKRASQIFRQGIGELLLVCFILTPVSSFAEIQMNAEYTVSTENLSVFGSIQEPYGLVTLLVLPADVAPESLTASVMDQERYAVKTVRADAGGAYTASLIMPRWAESGRYSVYVSDGMEMNRAEFTHFNTALASAALIRVNAADSAATLLAVLREEAGALALDESMIASYGMDFANGLYTARPAAPGYTLDGLMQELNRIYALCLIQSGDVTAAESALQSYASEFGLDYTESYQGLENTVKNIFCSLVRDGDFTQDTAYDIFMQSLIYAIVTGSSSYLDVMDAIEDYSSYMGLDMTGYNRLGTYKKSNVISGLMRGGLSGYSDIKPLFEMLVEEAANTSSNSSGGGGTGGGSYGGNSGRGYSDSFQADAEVVEGLKNDANDVSESTFTDISGHWAEQAVKTLAEENIINGFEDGSYRPENQVTRAEFAKMIVLALQLEQSGDTAFADVSQSDWHYSYVSAAHTAGLIQGYAGVFRPDDAITREECAVILYRALEHNGITLSGTCSFTDENDIADWAKTAVLALGAEGLLQGFDNRFQPQEETTRAEAAGMIYNLLSYTEGS